MTGKFEAQDVGFELTQSIKYGFFGQVYVPIRSAKLSHLGYRNKGAAEVNGVVIKDFIHEDFKTILAEHNMHPLLTSFSKSGITDITASAGWEGYTDIGSQWIMNLGGSMQIGVLLPVAGKLNKNYVAAIPVGYNYSVGAFARLAAEINVFKWIALGAYGDSILFFDQKQEMQMRTYEARTPHLDKQSGWLRLGKGFATLNTGSLWDCCGYIRIKPFVPGLSLFCGYSFTRQEAADVTVKDRDFSVLVTTISQSDPRKNAALYPSTNHGDQDMVVRSDPRFRAWVTQTLAFGATMEFCAETACSPRIQVEYNYPFDQVLGFKTPMVGGTAGVKFSLGF